MVKAKSNKSLKKRFKITGTGKLLRNKQGRRHKLAKKSAQKKRLLAKPVLVGEGFEKKYQQMIQGL